MRRHASGRSATRGGRPAWLDALLQPRRVAVVGASTDPRKISGRPVSYLGRYGFRGIIPVNPHASTVQGNRAVPRIDAIDGPVDVAVIGLPAGQTVQAIEELADLGCTAAIVLSSGWAEVGGDGPALQRRLVDISVATGIRVLGPNCLGAVSVARRIPLTFTSALDEIDLVPGRIALVSQSGAVASFLFSAAQRGGIGVHSMFSTGNEADLSTAEVVGALAMDPDVSVIAGYVEGARDPIALAAALSAARETGTAVVLLPGGLTPPGSRAASAHTGLPPIAGELAEIVERSGAHAVSGMQSLLDTATALAARRPAGGRVAIVTISGGAGAVTADEAVRAGLDVPPLDPTTRGRLAGVVPAFGSVGNPVDITGAAVADPRLLGRVLDVLSQARSFDAVMVMLGNVTDGEDELVDALARFRHASELAMAVAWVGGSGRPRAALNRVAIPTYDDPGRAVRALATALASGTGVPENRATEAEEVAS